MALQSMTGFARHQGQFEGTSWVWELRSVNGKGLDIRTRIPNGFEAIEAAARAKLPKLFTRGNMQVSLTMTQTQGGCVPYINMQAIDALLQAAKELQAKTGGDLPTVAELMAVRGVVELGENQMDEADKARLDDRIIQSLEGAAHALLEVRTVEGNEIAVILSAQVEKIESLYRAISGDPSRTPEAIKSALRLQVAKLVANDEKLDEDRLYQEVAILAAKADLQEELDRLVVHLKAAKELLSSEGPVGRRLDFLAQEFNRECNTICSKSNSAAVTSLGLDMKLVIDQFREQLQNME